MAQPDRFYIGMLDNSASLNTYLKPYALPDNAFASLNNAYVFRGRVRKRFGARLLRGTTPPATGYEQLQSRLRINLGNTDGAGAFGPSTVPGAVFEIGQAFSVGSQIFTVYQNGALLSTGTATGTYNTATGSVTIAGAAAATAVYFYPAQPVMGFVNYQNPNPGIEDVIAFDTQFAYQYGSTGWERMGTAVWTGSDSQFFWGASGRGTSQADTWVFVSNYNTGTDLTDSDPMYYWDGAAWQTFQPGFNSGTATDTILSARIIVTFKNRLVLLNVVENTGAGPGTNTTYANRCRYSWIGDPTNAAAFYDDVPGNGSFIDAPTKESIITAQFLKDRLIVYFESSTWELVYTGNQIEPFVWQQINTELGAESTFSQVPFDKYVLGVGNVGIHACNGSNVDRIDDTIPDTVFDIHNDNNGIERVAGIRDYYTEMVYWTFPDSFATDEQPYCNKILTYNYKTGSWAFNDDSFTAFGYFQTNVAGNSGALLWRDASMTWQDADFTWNSPTLQAKFKSVIAGNQEGYTFIVDSNLSTNCDSLQVTAFSVTNTDPVIVDGVTKYVSTCSFTSINHNLRPGQYVQLKNAQVTGGVSTNLNTVIFKVNTIPTADTFTGFTLPQDATPTVGTYVGGGTLIRVTPIDFKTKQFNFYVNSDRNAYVSRLDCLVDRTQNGQCTIDFMVSSSDQGMNDQIFLTGASMGNGTLTTAPYDLIPFEAQQTRLWHPVYFHADGEYVQFRFYLNDDQAMDPDISGEYFELHAMVVFAQPTTSRLQ